MWYTLLIALPALSGVAAFALAALVLQRRKLYPWYLAVLPMVERRTAPPGLAHHG